MIKFKKIVNYFVVEVILFLIFKFQTYNRKKIWYENILKISISHFVDILQSFAFREPYLLIHKCFFGHSLMVKIGSFNNFKMWVNQVTNV